MKSIRIICCLLLGASACTEQVPQSTSSREEPKVKSNINLLSGTWKSPCTRGAVEYVQSHISFSNGNFRQQNQFHPDENCSITNKSPSVIDGIYDIGVEFITSSGIKARKLDYVINEGGSTIRLPDLYYQKDNILYFGPKITDAVRASVLDFDYPFTRQQ